MTRLQIDPLKDSRERLQAALDASKTGTWRWDIPANTLDWDENLNRLFGLPPGGSVPTLADFIALVHPDDRQMVDEACQRSIQDGFATRLEYRVLWTDGSLHWIDDRGRTVFDEDGRPLYMTGACVDITERKEAEQLLREAELRKDEFLAMLAHELRNPLAPIRNSIEVVRQLNPGGELAARAHAIIDRQIGHLVRLVDDLLDVSRIARGKIELRKERCSLARIVQQTVDDYRPIFSELGIAITASIPPDDLFVDGDATRLAQVVSNILHNSSKFTGKGGWVRVRLQRTHTPPSVVLEIEDTGAGLDADLLQRMFVAFAQGPRGAASLQSGLGLGLAVVRGLVELHGGTAEAASPGPGQGTTITLRVPASDAAPAGVPEPPRARSAQPLRVLVVDDNVDAADSLRMILELLGHHAQAVYYGGDAVSAAERYGADLMLCDIGLPGGVDGYEIARRIRTHPAMKDLYLVALTGWGQPDDRRKAFDAGFNVHLTKPASPDHLETLLAEVSRKLSRG